MSFFIGLCVGVIVGLIVGDLYGYRQGLKDLSDMLIDSIKSGEFGKGK